MSAVHVTVLNNSDQTVSFLLDSERDEERINHLKVLKRRGDLQEVDVTDASDAETPKRRGPAAKKASGRKPGPVPGTNRPAPVNSDAVEAHEEAKEDELKD